MAEFGPQQVDAARRPLRVEVDGGRHHVFVRVLPAVALGDVIGAAELPPADRIVRYLALFLANEDGSPRYPDPDAEVLAELGAWPAMVAQSVVNAGTEHNGLEVDYEGNSDGAPSGNSP